MKQEESDRVSRLRVIMARKKEEESGSNPLVSIVIVTHNRKNKVMRLLNTLSKDNSRDLEVILVDDASTDGTSEEVRSAFPEVRIARINNEVFLAEARNVGLHYASAKYVLFADDDIVIEKNGITIMLRFLEEHPRYGIAGPVVVYLRNKGVIWHTGVVFTAYSLKENSYLKNHDTLDSTKLVGFFDCSYVPGIFMAKTKILRELGGFDSENFPFSYEDLDLALRMKKVGFNVACVLSALALHDIDETYSGRVIGPARAFHHGRSRTRFYLKYYRWKLALLPAYFFGFIATQIPGDHIDIGGFAHVAESYLKGIFHGISGI